ncbi:flavodoxin domain-containing protein [Rhizobium sp. CECT 9324]|jgi:menaquinone-dependent protoporphyrinogen oxidase|uniref:flavodoxin domain-containing protein n=1 Tax=Rhizobium sp. CECT 9324 TaxID=2845820 RepID=UPI001E37D331|nr:flavodoxin domain-containing protein [Rhizobium sp. CECT 9324]CAH0341041.1 Protoporphyrinogen IX dehydrogenase [menaquinone] [Rhizobium sp. CECT 9324]
MIVLVGYVSIEGQTRKIAEAIAAEIEKHGHRALLFNVGEMVEYGVDHPQAAILCAPVHAGRYPDPFVGFVRREADWLKSIPTAFVSVSLLIRSELEEERQEAQDFAGSLFAETHWRPGMVHHAAGALRYSEYDFFKRWMMRRMAARERASTDVSQDHQFTDWTALATFTTEFLKAAVQ